MAISPAESGIMRAGGEEDEPMRAPAPIPMEITEVGGGSVGIRWDDGHRGLHGLRALRLACPCANCVDEVTGRRLISPDRIPDGVSIRSTSRVGRYALQIVWSDGHDTGLYSYRTLRSVCECEACRGIEPGAPA
jgi:ATP-binding protein involved in chromosome partitioning